MRAIVNKDGIFVVKRNRRSECDFGAVVADAPISLICRTFDPVGVVTPISRSSIDRRPFVYGAAERCEAEGRRTKKRDAQYLETETLRAHADALAARLDGTIDWEKPLIQARFG